MRKNRSAGVALGLASSVLLVSVALADQAMEQGGGRNVGEMTFAPVPGLPTCAPGALQSGDPSKGPSVLLARIKTGCTIPWHWHTPNEHVMIVSGTARFEMKDSDKPLVLKAGGYALMPSKHVHQARCLKQCTMFIYSDDKFDIHYVNPDGKEIPPEQALEHVRETVASK